jgi:hypothetical protein
VCETESIWNTLHSSQHVSFMLRYAYFCTEIDAVLRTVIYHRPVNTVPPSISAIGLGNPLIVCASKPP